MKTTRFLYQLALGALFGKILCFAVVFAPKVFKVLERSDASLLQRSLFPTYYLLEVILSTLSLLLILHPRILKFSSTRNLKWRLSLLLNLLLFAFACYAYFDLSPTISLLSEQGLAQGEDFQKLHSRSVTLNASSLFIAALLLSLIP